MNKYDAIVLGTGGAGSAALYHLAKKTDHVLGLDQFPAGHDRGSSHGETRVIRQAYFEHPDYVPLLERAYELWHELEAQVSSQLFFKVGLLEIGPSGGMLIEGVNKAARLHDLAVEEINEKELEKRFPGFRVPEGSEALFESNAGYLLVEKCVLSHLEMAQKTGATLRTGETILSWNIEDSGIITVKTDKATYQADRLVITPGAWAPVLLNDLDLNLKVVRKHLHWYGESTNQKYHESQGAPTFFYETPDGCFYGFPMRDKSGLKIAEHTGGEAVTDPLNVDRSPDPVDQNRVEQFLKSNLPEVKLTRNRHSVCMYTLSQDENFIIDHHPEHDQVVFAAGLSGHGFKFASVIGEVLAQMVLAGKTNLPVEFLKRR